MNPPAERESSFPRWAVLYRWALPVYWAALFTATHIPKVPFADRAPQRTDKVVHFVVFAMLAFLLWRFHQVRRGRVGELFVWVATVVIATYAAADEILQEFVGRSLEFYDWLADVSGAVMVLAVLEWRRRRAAAASELVTSIDSSASADGS